MNNITSKIFPKEFCNKLNAKFPCFKNNLKIKTVALEIIKGLGLVLAGATFGRFVLLPFFLTYFVYWDCHRGCNRGLTYGATFGVLNVIKHNIIHNTRFELKSL